MTITVKLFGPQAAMAKTREVRLDVDRPATAATVRAALGVEVPALAQTLSGSRIAVDHEYVGDDEPVDGRKEVALIGMVSGG